MQGSWRAASSVCCFQQASLSGSLPIDLCRIIDHNLYHALVTEVMTADRKAICSGMLAAEVLQIMGSTGSTRCPPSTPRMNYSAQWICMTCCAQAWYNTRL